jgi:AGZA family xanthine/uracil permease-like MFS transporter
LGGFDAQLPLETVADTVVNLGFGTGTPWAVGYILLAILFFYTQWQTRHQKANQKVVQSPSQNALDGNLKK